MLSFFMVYHICYHFWSTGCYLFRVWYHFFGCYHLCYHLVLSFIFCYNLMLSFLTVCKCYHFCVIVFPCTVWVLSFMLSFNVIIFCYHFPPLFFFLKMWHTLRIAINKLFWSAHLPQRRHGFDSWPGHVNFGNSSLGLRWPWSSLSIIYLHNPSVKGWDI